VVDHKAHVWLVDAHPKGDGGHYHLHASVVLVQAYVKKKQV
jgi:hypothetical protein